MAAAKQNIKFKKADGEDEIRSEMLKTLHEEGVHRLTRVCLVAWKLGKTPKDWQTGVMTPIYKEGNCNECTNYGGISFVSVSGSVYAKCFERQCREIVDQSWKMATVVFVQVVAPRTKLSL